MSRSATRFLWIRDEYASMPDLKLRSRAPLDDLAVPGRFGAGTRKPGLVIEERTDLALATLIARRGETQNLRHAIAAAYGLALPEGSYVVTKDGVSFAGIGVGKWLGVAEGPAALGYISGLRGRLMGLASIADQSDGRVVLRLSGEQVREILAKGIPLDLHPRNFKTGDIASTMISQMGVQIQQLDDRPTFQLMAFRSFAGSLLSWLAKSAAQFGYEIAPPEHR
jgi:methylglutamate dehydrogenase subunit D